MGNFRQHVGFAGFLGIFLAWGAQVVLGLHWIYGSVAALLTTFGGLLPDLDSESSVQLRGFTGLLGVLAAVAFWHGVNDLGLLIPFELQLWGAILSFVLVRHGLRRGLAYFTVHRGMHHSIPAALSWGGVTYLLYPSNSDSIRIIMSIAVMLGSLSHLFLDEICSVDLRGRRINKSFGTAMKFWSKSLGATLTAYFILGIVTWQVINHLPAHLLSERLPIPEIGVVGSVEGRP